MLIWIKSFANVLTFALLISLSNIVHATSLDEFKRNVAARFPESDLANNFELVIQSAIETKVGDGSRKMIIFLDPYCFYCDKLEKNLTYLNNVTIYTLMFPLDVKSSSTVAVEYIWCAKNQSEALSDWFAQKKRVVPESFSRCATPSNYVQSLVRSLNIVGTPAVIFGNGVSKYGAVPVHILERNLGS